MLNYKKMILSTTLAMAIIAPTAVYAAPLNDVKPGSNMSVCEKKSLKIIVKWKTKKMTKDCKMTQRVIQKIMKSFKSKNTIKKKK